MLPNATKCARDVWRGKDRQSSLRRDDVPPDIRAGAYGGASIPTSGTSVSFDLFHTICSA